MANQSARLPLPCRGIACLCLIAVCGLVLFSATAGGSELRQTPIVKAVQVARPSVVNIRGEKTVGNTSGLMVQGDSARRVNGMGTGVVIDPRGYIITNHHVIDGVRRIQITTADEQQYTAKLIARDPETDLAIIKIDPVEPLPVINIGKSADLMAGETVVAVGNAYGYQHTATQGIISALHRAVQISDAQFYEDLIQTDASINPGNSGGPLLNIDGQMIGINVAVRAGAQGIGFAIPVDKVTAVITGLLASRNIQKSWLGVRFQAESSSEAGPVVNAVDSGSPAEEVGLQAGDVITGVDDEETTSALDFHRTLLERDAGDELILRVQRGEEELVFDLTLAEVPTNLQVPTNSQLSASPTWQPLGLDLEPIPSHEFRQRFQTHYRGGLTVKAVRPDSPAFSQGIRRGDVLVGMHVWQTISLENVVYILNRPDFSSLNPVKFFVLRGSETFYGYLPLTLRDVQQR